MNFLEIVNEVNLLAQIQGSISDTASTVGIQGVIVAATRNAWIDIQNYRKDWTFMIDRTSFLTVEGQEIYTPAEVFSGVGESEDDLGLYIEERVMYDYRNLKFILPKDYPFIENTTPSRPTWFAIEPSNNYLYLSIPDGEYTITPYYIRNPQVLTASTDTPLLPVRYHRLIVYRAVEIFASQVENSALYQRYALSEAQLMGSLMREYVPAVKVDLNGGIA